MSPLPTVIRIGITTGYRCMYLLIFIKLFQHFPARENEECSKYDVEDEYDDGEQGEDTVGNLLIAGVVIYFHVHDLAERELAPVNGCLKTLNYNHHTCTNDATNVDWLLVIIENVERNEREKDENECC